VSSCCRTAGDLDRCNHSLKAVGKEQHEHVEWRRIFGVKKDAGSESKLVSLKCVAEVGQQGCLATEVVDCFNNKPSVVNVGKQILSPGTACIKLDIMPIRSPLSLTGIKLIVCNTCSLYSGIVPFVICPVVSTDHMHAICYDNVLLMGCNMLLKIFLHSKKSIKSLAYSPLLPVKPQLIQ
jgi:hypothetical protein